jgi:uncharacterized protein involved in exopolysaccharide biosynthesis/Mrp family chromosome partitioning ATPase
MLNSDQPVPGPAPAGEPGDTDLSGLFSIMKRHISGIAMVTLAALGLTLAYVLLTPPVYTATATLFIDPRARKLVADDVVQGGLATDAALVESQVPIITSDSVLGRAVDSLKLTDDPEFSPAARSGLLAPLKDLIRGPRPLADPHTFALEQLSRAVKVKRAQKTYIVDIEVDHTSPAKAARIANAIAEAYLADQTESKAAEARRANGLIDARLGELSDQVRMAETRIDEFKKANRILTSEGGVVTEQQLGKLNAELASAHAVAAESKARFEQAEAAARGKVNPDTLPDAVKSGLIQKLRDQYAQVARREAALNTQLHARHPMLIEVRSQLREIHDQIGEELKRLAASSKSEYQIATAREVELARTIELSKEEVARTNTAQIKLRELEREADAGRELLKAFLARAKETQEQQNISTPEARIVSQAAIPSHPSKPSTMLFLALGLIGGLGLGIARALAKDHLDGTIRSSHDLKRCGGLKLAGELPLVAGGSLLGRLMHKSRSGADRIETSGYSDLLQSISDTRGAPAPAYRQAVLRLAGRLRAGVRPGQPLAIMVASARSRAGASATALALAYSAAITGEKVLLVDGASLDAGLSAVFAPDPNPNEPVALDSKEHLARITAYDQRSGLAFLPLALSDLRVLKSEQKRRLITGLNAVAQDYDIVVVDGGSLLEDQSAISLLPAIDRIVIVAAAGETQREELVRTVEALEPAAERIVGVVINRSERS